MFGGRYNAGYLAQTYFPSGLSSDTNGVFFAARWFPERYFTASYFPGYITPTPIPPTPPVSTDDRDPIGHYDHKKYKRKLHELMEANQRFLDSKLATQGETRLALQEARKELQKVEDFHVESQKAVLEAASHEREEIRHNIYHEIHEQILIATAKLTAYIKAVEEEEDDIHALLVTMGDWV